MDHFIDIYQNKAAQYHRMIGPEDVDNNLLPAIERVTSIAGKRILDLGSGTGRLPLLFGHKTAQMICLDLHAGMLKEHQRQRNKLAGKWRLLQVDMRAVPLPSGWAQVVTAGWALGHFAGWYGDDWQCQAGRVLHEMHRVAAPGGALIIIETLTTGGLTPIPPTKKLASYYAWLESKWGFDRQEINTDYQFANANEAATQVEFFFGPDLAAKVRQNNWARLPEWTGVWGKQL